MNTITIGGKPYTLSPVAEVGAAAAAAFVLALLVEYAAPIGVPLAALVAVGLGLKAWGEL